jgi:hypothetical protein
MALKKILRSVASIISGLIFILPVVSGAENPLGQTLQINTNFDSLKGNPTWLLVIRNTQTGEILPYMYEIKNSDNFWIALSYGRNYRIVSSRLQFESSKSISNFCNLEDGVISGKSYVIRLSGNLRPGGNDYECHTIKFKDYNFQMPADSG